MIGAETLYSPIEVHRADTFYLSGTLKLAASFGSFGKVTGTSTDSTDSTGIF